MDQYTKWKLRAFATVLGGSLTKDGSFLVESIVQGRMPSDLLQRILADLRAKRHLAQSAAERIAIDGAIADVLDGIFASGGSLPIPTNAPEPDPAAVTIQHVVAERPMSEHSPFYGMGLKEACPKLLRLIEKKRGKIPQTAREIWDQLRAEGWTSNHGKPAHSVNDALRRRAKTHHDVMLVGSGKWGLVDWYSDAELEEIRKSMGGMGGRDKGAHIERTKAGMATARARGATLGAARKLTDEQGKQIVELVRTGVSKARVARQFGISPASVNNYLARAEPDEPIDEEAGETRH
ncbi:MAG: hypothetical protein NW223_03130 [Hyphomicrobiaceae bacterium]|nr:hypothetical protein [Hyphomicrobiaceae bacterium]